MTSASGKLGRLCLNVPVTLPTDRKVNLHTEQRGSVWRSKYDLTVGSVLDIKL